MFVCECQAVVVFRGYIHNFTTENTAFQAECSKSRLNRSMVSLEFDSAHVVAAHSKGCGFAEDQPCEHSLECWAAHDLQQGPRALLFHLERNQADVESSCRA